MQKNHTTNEQENMYSDAELLSSCNLHTQLIFTIIQRSSTLTKVRNEKVITQKKMEILDHPRSYNFILECQFVRI